MSDLNATPLGLAYESIGTFVSVSDAQRLHIALWSAATNVYRIFPAFARLDFSAAGPGCGKSTALEVTLALCPEPVVVSYTTPAAVKCWFDEHPDSTMGLDERDTLFGTTGRVTGARSELIAMLNAGYAANGQAMCQRNGKSVLMDVYNAIAHAGIGRAYAALADRSVTITLNKSMPAQPWVSPLHERDLHAAGADMARWLSGPAEQRALRSAPAMVAGLSDDPRHCLKMAPMGAVAALAGVSDEFRAADEDIRSGIRHNPMPSRAEILLASLAPLAGQRVTADDIRAALPGQFTDGRIGDVTIAGLLAQVDVLSTVSNGVRGYLLPTTQGGNTYTQQTTQNTGNTCVSDERARLAALAESLGA